jgi:hypothetical protein
MKDSTERVITALMIDIFFFASIPLMYLLPTFFGSVASQLNYANGWWYGIEWFGVCRTLLQIYWWLIYALPFYALIQAAPEGAFDFYKDTL